VIGVHACGFDTSFGNDANRVAPMSMSGNDEPEEHTPPGCSQFCADNLPVLAKIKQIEDQFSPQALPVVALLSITPSLTGALPAATPPGTSRPRGRISLNIRFVRLSL
jgi:hypothetical protein